LAGQAPSQGIDPADLRQDRPGVGDDVVVRAQVEGEAH
jgi:hypothetical protein